MQTTQHAILEALPKVASILGRRFGINVSFGGGRAYTDGNNINIPSLPLESSEYIIQLANAYIDHEASHIRFTDFSVLSTAHMTPLTKHILNIIEDWVRCVGL